MRYYIETQVWRHDGSEYWTRYRVASLHAAEDGVRALIALGFRDQVLCNDTRTSLVVCNDFGEIIAIRATMYGDAAQVREGSFTL